jgi:uncharacterized protein
VGIATAAARRYHVAMEFEWDADKATLNEEKHGISFHEAATIFGDPLSMTYYDPNHSSDEDRYITIGTSQSGRLLIVSHTDRGEAVRIISARKATARERRQYEEEA